MSPCYCLYLSLASLSMSLSYSLLSHCFPQSQFIPVSFYISLSLSFFHVLSFSLSVSTFPRCLGSDLPVISLSFIIISLSFIFHPLFPALISPLWSSVWRSVPGSVTASHRWRILALWFCFESARQCFSFDAVYMALTLPWLSIQLHFSFAITSPETDYLLSTIKRR